MIVDYLPSYNTSMHVEFGVICDGQIQFETATGTTTTLPETSETVSRYMERSAMA